jgi:hypothetical protein
VCTHYNPQAAQIEPSCTARQDMACMAAVPSTMCPLFAHVTLHAHKTTAAAHHLRRMYRPQHHSATHHPLLLMCTSQPRKEAGHIHSFASWGLMMSTERKSPMAQMQGDSKLATCMPPSRVPSPGAAATQALVPKASSAPARWRHCGFHICYAHSACAQLCTGATQ